MADLLQRWVSAMRGEAYEAAWAAATEALEQRDPATRDDARLPYHKRWVWDGRPFDGKHVLVRCYRGLGDTLQYARFLPLLADRAASVTLEVQPRLAPLLDGSPTLAKVIPFNPATPVPASECEMEITELDFVLRTPPTEAPAPYLSASRAVLPRGTVGFCYGAGEWDRDRSIPAELLAPLCRLAPCLTLMPEPTDLPVLNPGGCPYDMTMTAALVSACDLIVTVDTMIAHLAGALGKPTWLLLKSEPDWRWSPRKRTTAWYGSMRLYSQPGPGQWLEVAAQLARDLAARARSVVRG
jgi:hypothetical protein